LGVLGTGFVFISCVPKTMPYLRAILGHLN
jgi:hypothetical protein